MRRAGADGFVIRATRPDRGGTATGASPVKRTSRDIRTANRYEVLRQIIAASPTSRQELAAATGLSLATVANLVGELLELGLLAEVGFEDSGGRPPARRSWPSTPPAGALIGVDVAETYVHVELFDPALNVLASVEEDLHPGENRPEQVVGACRRRRRRRWSRRPGSRAPGCSASASACRARSTATAASRCTRRTGTGTTCRCCDLLAEHIAYPLYLDNPLRACAVAELWFGAGRGREDVVVVNLGTGVGAGLALGGGLHRGATNSAGEWGHTTLVLDGRLCHCGNRGCVETYVGRARHHAEPARAGPDSPLLHPEDQTATIDALARGVAAQRPGGGQGGPRHRPLPRRAASPT